jgi:two-component system, LytTR family, sensor histidine kinase AlgZ
VERTPGRGDRLLLYLALVALISTLLGILLSAGRGLDWPDAATIAIPLAALYAFVCLSAWYVARSMPLARTGIVRLAITAASAALVSSAVWLGLARVWIQVLGRRWAAIDPSELAGAETLVFGFGLLLYLLSLALSYLIGGFEHSREAERRSLQAQVLSREAELRSLRAQIDPHFLFNSLHSISALTVADPQGARRMCLLLADFLRDSLMLGAEARIPFKQELDLARRFLEVERVRFGERLRLDVNAGNAAACLVPPLVLQPLVENAVTHGIAHVLEGGIVRIAARCSSAVLSIVVENPCDPDRPSRAGGGVGLSNVRARLRALHGDEARVHAGERDGVWRVEVTMPVVTNPVVTTPGE